MNRCLTPWHRREQNKTVLYRRRYGTVFALWDGGRIATSDFVLLAMTVGIRLSLRGA